MKKIINKHLNTILVVIVSVVGLSMLLGTGIALGNALFSNLGFYITAIAYIFFVAWLWENQRFTENSRVIIAILVFMLGLGLYMWFQGPTSNNGSYLEEACPDCGQY